MSNECDLLLDYFNNQLTREQQEEFEIHLLTCAECQEELSELQQLTEDLPYSSEAIEPPSGMKARVLSNIVKETTNSETVDKKEDKELDNVTQISEWNEPKKNKKNGLIKPLLAAVLTISLVGNAAAIIYLSNEDEDSETTTELEDTSLDEIQKMVSLSPSEGISAEATAMMIEQQNSKTNLVVQANDLPELEGNETYQVWVLEDGKPYRAGTFVSNENGNGAVSYIMNYEGKHQFDTIAITKEPDANSQTPKGEIVLSSPLS